MNDILIVVFVDVFMYISDTYSQSLLGAGFLITISVSIFTYCCYLEVTENTENVQINNDGRRNYRKALWGAHMKVILHIKVVCAAL